MEKSFYFWRLDVAYYHWEGSPFKVDHDHDHTCNPHHELNQMNMITIWWCQHNDVNSLLMSTWWRQHFVDFNTPCTKQRGVISGLGKYYLPQSYRLTSSKSLAVHYSPQFKWNAGKNRNYVKLESVWTLIRINGLTPRKSHRILALCHMKSWQKV